MNTELWKSLLFRECRQILADKTRVVFLFAPALLYVLVFGMLYFPNVVKEIPCIIYDADQSVLSRRVGVSFEDSDSIHVIGYAHTQEEMQEALRNKEAFAAIEIPADFSQLIAAGGSSAVLLMVNGSNIIMTNTVSSAAQDIVAQISSETAVTRAALRTGINAGHLANRITPIHVQLRVLYNTTQGYLFFFLIGLAMAAFQQGLFFAVGASVCDEYGQDVSLHPRAALLIKLALYGVLALLSYLMIVTVLVRMVGIPLYAPLAPLMLLAAVYIFAAEAFVMFFASLFRRGIDFVRAIIVYPVPAFILSGYTWPTEAMGSGMQLLAKLFPLTQLSNTVRELFLMGFSPHFSTSIRNLLILGAVFLAAALWRFPRIIHQREG